MQTKTDRTNLAYRIAQHFELQIKDISASESGYRNHSFKTRLQNGKSVNIMIYKAEPSIRARIERADLVSGFLHTQGLPVRVRADERLLKLKYPNNVYESYAAIYNYLPGKTIAWESYTKDHIKVLGLAMAQMHAAFKAGRASGVTSEVALQVSIYAELTELVDRMHNYFKTTAVTKAVSAKLRLKLTANYIHLKKAIVNAKNLPDQHLLHMDLVRSNILFQKTLHNRDNPCKEQRCCIVCGAVVVSGIIDFEKVSYGSPLFDLARTLAFLLVDCKYKDPIKVRKYFLHSGYQKRGGMRISQIRLLNVYVDLFLLHDFYKFLKHNPYEFLHQNEHYIRTRDILIERNMLKYEA